MDTHMKHEGKWYEEVEMYSEFIERKVSVDQSTEHGAIHFSLWTVIESPPSYSVGSKV